MPRTPRIEYEDAIYHVLARGDRREPIVFDDVDREMFLRTLSQTCVRSGWKIYAWVLMDNHYHLALRTPKANLVEGMTWFQNTFTARINARHGLWGHLFGGRYKAIVVEGQESVNSSSQQQYLPALIDYIHLNPARAGLMDGKESSVMDFSWSSLARGYVITPTKRPDWLLVKEGLGMFGEKDNTRGRCRYTQHLDSRIEDEGHGRVGIVEEEGRSLQSTLRRGWYWGSEAFKERLLGRFGNEATKRKNRDDRSSEIVQDHNEKTAERIVELACVFFKLEEEELFQKMQADLIRPAVAWKVWRHTTVPQIWSAERMRLKTAANVSQTVRRFDKINEKELPLNILEWKELKIVD